MAADGSKGPKPYKQVKTATAFLRVPVAEWPAVSAGAKTEFRAGHGTASQIALQGQTPTPVVAYTVTSTGRYSAKLMVLEEAWLEALAAITPESLAREGYRSFAEFREAWVNRERKRFRPQTRVWCYRVRAFTPDDRREMADLIFQRLYEEWL